MAKVTPLQFNKAFSQLVGMPVPSRNTILEQIEYALTSSERFSMPWDINDIVVVDDKFPVIGNLIDLKPSAKINKIIGQNPDLIYVCFDAVMPLKEGIFICMQTTASEIRDYSNKYSHDLNNLILINKQLMISHLANFVKKD